MAKQADRLRTVQQSENALRQWKDLWTTHAKYHSRFAPFKPFSDFQNIGVGKACLLVANGYSFEKNAEIIKAHAAGVDILCCDKTLGHLIKMGIKPTYCLVADAMVDYDKYMKPYKDQLDETVLFMTVTANMKWSANGNWKDRYFMVNHDAIGSEKTFMALSGCQNTVPAGTNVSNAMVVLLTQSDNSGRRNFFGYDKLLLIGFDYCWMNEGGYYAFDWEAGGKRNYMRHVYCITKSGKHAYTSLNLTYSAQWLQTYINSFKLPVVQCSGDTVLQIEYTGDLAKQMQYSFQPEDSTFVREQIEKRDKLLKEVHDINNRVLNLGTEHYYKFLASI